MSLYLIFFYENDGDKNLISRKLTCIYQDYDKALSELNKIDVSYKKRNPDSDNYYVIEFWKTVD